MKAKIKVCFKFGNVKEKLMECELYLVDENGVDAYIENLIKFYSMQTKTVKREYNKIFIEDEKILMVVEEFID